MLPNQHYGSKQVVSALQRYLSNGNQYDVAGDNLDDVDLQQPPDKELQFMEVLEELEEEHGEPVHHQVPFALQVWKKIATVL